MKKIKKGSANNHKHDKKRAEKRKVFRLMSEQITIAIRRKHRDRNKEILSR